MTPSDQINKLICALDPNEDHLLLEMLKMKLTQIAEQEEYKHKQQYDITDQEHRLAKSACRQIIKIQIERSDPEFAKAQKAMRIGDCSYDVCNSCKFGLIKESINTYTGGSYSYTTPDDTERCDRCRDRRRWLKGYAESIHDRIADLVNDTVENQYGYIRMRAMITKIRAKIKQLQT